MVDLALFLPACFALNLAFGPNNLLALTHGAQGGIAFALKAAFGRLLVFVPMIAASALGLGLLLSASATVFNAVKLIGAAYLIYLGIRLWRSTGTTAALHAGGKRPSLRHAFRSEATVAASNPKAILIFAAFFPQFVIPGQYWESYALLGCLFLAMEAVAIFLYALIGMYAVRLAARRLSWVQRASGATMGLFGALLLMSPQPGRT